MAKGYDANILDCFERSRLYDVMSGSRRTILIPLKGWRFLDNKRVAIRASDGLTLTLDDFENCELLT